MRPPRMLALTGALALACAGFATLTPAAAAPAAATAPTTYTVLAKSGANAQSLAQQLKAAGATVNSVNDAIGLVSVTSTKGDFLASTRGLAGVQLAAAEGVVGRAPAPTAKPKSAIEKPGKDTGNSHGNSAWEKKGFKGAADPLDSKLWGMQMIQAPEAHAVEMGDKRVKVGIIDTGLDASHPDIAPNFDAKASRNFVTDIPEIDGACEYDGCVDPVGVDNGGHGTHVAGTIGAAMNGLGVSGVAPDVSLVEVRAGQDSGYFFLTPTVNALTYSGDAGIDVVNMSFYVDPWLFNCVGGAPEDSPEAAATQNVTIEAMSRALNYAHGKGVTLVAALGNDRLDLAKPPADLTSPDYDNPAYAWDSSPYKRTISNATCLNLPTEGPNVIGVSSLGPSQRKAYYSNWTTDLNSGEIEVSAPGGDAWDYSLMGRPDNMILSTIPLNVLQAEGAVDNAGNVTPDNEGWVFKDCRTIPGKGEQCGYYEYMQGTSMASPHAAGVAALIVSAHGKQQGKAGFGLAPDTVKSILMSTATDHACPAGGVQTYPELPAASQPRYAAPCVGTAAFNGHYGDGIVNALKAVS